MRKLLLGLCCWAVVQATVAADMQAFAAAGNPPQLDCRKGPVVKTYGGTDWQVYGCDDGKSLAMISVPGSPAAPFVFAMYPKDKGYELSGQGTGSKAYSDAASKEISAMSPADIQALLKETQGIVANPWPEPHMPPCKDMSPITAGNLTGIWTSVDAPYQETTHYYEDGSFSGRLEDHGKIVWLYSGSWKLDGHTIETVYSFSSLDRVAVGTTDNDEILGIGCGVIAFRSKDGTVGRYKLEKP